MRPLLHILASPATWIATLLVGTSAYGLTSRRSPLFALVPSIAVLGFALLWAIPVMGAYLFIATIPYGQYRALTAISGIQLHWILSAGLVVVILLRLLLRLPTEVQEGYSVWVAYLVPLVLVWVLSTMQSPYAGLVLKQLFLLMAAVALIVAFFFVVPLRSVTSTIPKIIIISVSISAFLAVLASQGISILETAAESEGRATGGSNDPNALSYMLLFSVSFQTYFMVYGKGWIRPVAVVGLALVAMAIPAAQSRSGFLIAIINGLLLLGEYREFFGAKNLWRLTAIVGLIGVGAFFFMPADYISRLGTIKNFSKGTDAAETATARRASYFVVGKEMISQRPMLGYGPLSFREYFSKTRFADRYTREEQTPRRFAHNSYTEHLAGTGILGLLCFLAILVRVVWNFSRAKHLAMARGDIPSARMAGSYRISAITFFAVLFFYSEMFPKYLLMLIALSEIFFRGEQRRSLETPALEASA